MNIQLAIHLTSSRAVRSVEWGRQALQRGAKSWNARVAFFIPDSFAFAILLTFAAYLLGMLRAYQGPWDMIRFWAAGFWNLLAFAMQMTLAVMAGFSLASVPPGRKMLRFLAALPRSPRQAMMFITALPALLSWLHWGIALVAGAFLAREMARRKPGMDYPLLVAGAFAGMCAGSFGLSAWEPQAVNKSGHLLEKAMGTLPPEETVFSAMALGGFLLGTAAVTLFMGVICPEEREAAPAGAEVFGRLAEEERAEEASRTAERQIREEGGASFGVWLEHSRWPAWLISIMGFSYIVSRFCARGFDLNLNLLNFILLLTALLLHETPMRFIKAMERSVRCVSGILVQFPFYAGIQGMLAFSGAAAILCGAIASTSSPQVFPLRVYLEAALVNFFVPTSEAIWEMQGPWVIQAAQKAGASLPRAINAFTAGEIIGNVLQPFWALPILGICGLALRQIMGYCILSFLVLSLIWGFCILYLPI